jgi:hypothetical protein
MDMVAFAVLGYQALEIRGSVPVNENGVQFMPPVLNRYPVL